MPRKDERTLSDGTRQQIRLWEEDIGNVNLLRSHLKESDGVDDLSAAVRYALREVADRLRAEKKPADTVLESPTE